jgi:CRP-like cAMP-binding protein
MAVQRRLEQMRGEHVYNNNNYGEVQATLTMVEERIMDRLGRIEQAYSVIATPLYLTQCYTEEDLLELQRKMEVRLYAIIL